MDVQIDRVARKFDSEIILLTGGLGFMGKVFIERLLRETNVRKIYLLARSKSGSKPIERLTKMIQNPLFDKLKTTSSTESIISRIQMIEGDCGCENLNLSVSDEQLIIENVTMIYNFAATVNFNTKFKTSVEINIRGVRDLLQLAVKCKKLKIFLHLSTAYCHLKDRRLREKFYDPPANPHDIIELIEKYSESDVEQILSTYLSDSIPNSYVFTKAISESLVFEAYQKHKLPLLICRPAIVSATYENPIDGWTDNYNNLFGFTAAWGSGVLRTFYISNNFALNLIPVDFSINEIMIAVWDYLENEKHNTVEVINNDYIIYQYDKLESIMEIVRQKCPSDVMMWYPNLTPVKSKIQHLILAYLYQWIPSILIDFIFICLGKKPMFMDIQNKVMSSLQSLEFVYKSEWTFDTDNIEAIKLKLNPYENKKYKTTEHFDSEDKYLEFGTILAHGVRKYLFKQKDEDLPKAIKKVKILRIVDISVKLLMLYGFYCIIRQLLTIFIK